MTRGEEIMTMSLSGTRGDALEYLQEHGFSSVPVVKGTDKGTKYRGLISREDLTEYPDEDQLAVLVRRVPTASADDDLEVVAATTISEGARRIPVVDGDTIEDILAVTDVIRAITRGDIDGETKIGDVAVRDVNTTYIDVPLHVIEHEIFYANVPYAVALGDEASLAGIVAEVDIIGATRVVKGEAGTDDSVTSRDDKWTWKDIKAVGNHYIPTRNVEIPAGPVSKFMTDGLMSAAMRTTAKGAAQTMAREDIEQVPLVFGGELIGVIRDINLLEALYE